MAKTFFTVGPSQAHPKLGKLLKDALKKDIHSISHRGPQFQEIFASTIQSIKKLLDVPQNFHVFFLASGTEAMERIIENCVEERSFHLLAGSFGKRFYTTAVELKKDALKLEAPAGEGFNLSSVKIPEGTELVAITQNDTSTGVWLDPGEIHGLKKRYPRTIFALDLVSSTPYAKIDYSLIDCAFFSVQKGFGMPAGLGVLMANQKCIDKSLELQKKSVNIGTYHNFPTLMKYAEKNQTPETPNVLDIYILGKICELYSKEGIDTIRKATDTKANLMDEFFEAHKDFSPFVKNAEWRSPTTLVIETAAGSATVREKTLKKGFVIGAGYGENKEKHIRIANFPSHSIADVRKLLKALE